MLTKEKILESIKSLPDQFSADEIIARIILLDKIEIGLEQVAQGQVVSEEELDKRLAKWLE